MNNVQKLMSGTANLNDKRTTIKTVLGTLAAELKALPPLRASVALTVGTDRWEIMRSNPPCIIYYGYEGENLQKTQLLGCGNPRFEKEVALENVERVHDSLNFFLTYVLKEFPAIAEKLKPIFSAARS